MFRKYSQEWNMLQIIKTAECFQKMISIEISKVLKVTFFKYKNSIIIIILALYFRLK